MCPSVPPPQNEGDTKEQHNKERTGGLALSHLPLSSEEGWASGQCLQSAWGAVTSHTLSLKVPTVLPRVTSCSVSSSFQLPQSSLCCVRWPCPHCSFFL